jgi:hypothetical protein
MNETGKKRTSKKNLKTIYAGNDVKKAKILPQ